jgi:hypothetical protein
MTYIISRNKNGRLSEGPLFHLVHKSCFKIKTPQRKYLAFLKCSLKFVLLIQMHEALSTLKSLYPFAGVSSTQECESGD